MHNSKNMNKYKNTELTHDEADEILKKWKKNKIEYAENNHGQVYWNKSTGEVMWYGDEECNAELLEVK